MPVNNDNYSPVAYVPDAVRAFLQQNGFQVYDTCIGGRVQFIRKDEAITFGMEEYSVELRWQADDDRGEHWSQSFYISMSLPWWALQMPLEKYRWLFDISGVIPFAEPQKIAV